MKFKAIKGMILTLLLLGMLTLAFNIQPLKAEPMPIISVYPPISSALVNETFTVNITVTDVVITPNCSGLYGWEAWMTFNPQVINAVNATEGPFLKAASNETIWLPAKINNTEGIVRFGAMISPVPSYPPTGAVGNGTLATVTFEVMSEGATFIRFEYTDLYTVLYPGDPGKETLVRIEHTAEDGYFTNAPAHTLYEVVFIVYPDGRVAMSGALNETMVEEAYTELWMSGFAGINGNETSTVISADFTFTVPPEGRSQYPFNASDFTLFSEYSGGLLSTEISGSTTFPSYMASEFPFNITDFTVVGEYAGNMVEGSIIVDIWNGFPLDNIEIDFRGNNTYLYLNGSSTVIYGTYPNFGLELNETSLNDLLQNLTSTIPGRGPDSLYNMTDGVFECTRLSTTTTPYNAIGATVDYEAEFQGDFIEALGRTLGMMLYGNAWTDSADPSLYRMLNATWSSVENVSFLLTYAQAFKEADMNLVFFANITDLIDKRILLLPSIPDTPPEMVTFIEYVLNTTYCSVESAEFSLTYEDFMAVLTATVVIEGDFNAEINYIKSMLTTYVGEPLLPWQLQFINQTEIDLSNIRVSLSLNETAMDVDFSGFAVRPPIDVINATSFKLERFFNLTAGEDEPPKEGERLKVTVEGGSNVTHSVTIIRPGTVPEPDISAPDRMVWDNQAISGLKDLIFQIERDNTPPVIGTPVHTPEIPDPDEAVTVSVNVTDEESGVHTVTLSYSTDDGGTWDNVTMSKTTGDTYEGQIPGLPAGTQVKYKIIAYDNAENFAIDDNNGQYYVYVVAQVPFWTQWWFWAIVAGAGAGIVALAGAVYFLKKRKPPTAPTLPI